MSSTVGVRDDARFIDEFTAAASSAIPALTSVLTGEGFALPGPLTTASALAPLDPTDAEGRRANELLTKAAQLFAQRLLRPGRQSAEP
jgi:hypothetical protein